MRLKVFTTACLLSALALMIFFPFLLASRPSASEARLVRRAYAIRVLTYVGGTILVVAGAGIGSLLIMRNVREEYRRESMENVKMMVEGTLRDHQEGQSGRDSEESLRDS